MGGTQDGPQTFAWRKRAVGRQRLRDPAVNSPSVARVGKEVLPEYLVLKKPPRFESLMTDDSWHGYAVKSLETVQPTEESKGLSDEVLAVWCRSNFGSAVFGRRRSHKLTPFARWQRFPEPRK
jgi:hypothetical protein